MVNGKLLKFIMALSVVLLMKIPAIALSNFENVCFDCHPTLQKKIQNEKAHKPVEQGNCGSCHNPHASKHDGLLNEAKNVICYICHKNGQTNEFNRTIIHSPVKVGNCIACHDPHSSANNALLVKNREDICFSCHTKDSVITRKESHPLVKRGECISCHNPHSSNSEGLLKKESGELCPECHKVEEALFADAHLGYSIGKSDCSSCHSPHSSDTKTLLKASIHAPMEKKECSKCHNAKDSKDPLALKDEGAGLCYKCHQEILKDFKKVNNHQIGNRKNSCLNCHNPHASDTDHLLSRKLDKVCFKCHLDTKNRMEATTVKSTHSNIENCSSCHLPHGSDNGLFLIGNKGASSSCMEAKCHPTAVGFSHPTGPEIIDPRSNKEMDCLSCHDPMGTEYENHLRLDPKKELCEQSHKM